MIFFNGTFERSKLRADKSSTKITLNTFWYLFYVVRIKDSARQGEGEVFLGKKTPIKLFFLIGTKKLQMAFLTFFTLFTLKINLLDNKEKNWRFLLSNEKFWRILFLIFLKLRYLNNQFIIWLIAFYWDWDWDKPSRNTRYRDNF